MPNDRIPPSFSADRLELCGPHFDEQGRELFWSVDASRETGRTGVFNRDGRITDSAERRRVPGALEAGANVFTARVTRCILIALCPGVATDIPEDFRIDPRVDVRVPADATHVVVAALPRVLSYENDSGFGFGVTVESLGP